VPSFWADVRGALRAGLAGLVTGRCRTRPHGRVGLEVRGSAASCYDGVSVATGEAEAEDGAEAAEAIVESESEYNIGAVETASPDGTFVDQTST
jgi:hypothetical protein